MGLSGEVWNRADEPKPDTMSANLYALAVTVFVALGIAFAAAMSLVSLQWTWPFQNGWWLLGFSLGVLLVSICGVFIFTASDNWLVSLIGYALVAGPFGLFLGPVVSLYTPTSVLRVFVITAGIVVVLGLIGAIIPKSLESWGAWLLGGLLVLIVGQLAIPFAGFLGVNIGGALQVWDWVGIVLFAGLTVFDLNRAMRLPHTLDNAVDSAAAVFLDFLNIFIRLLELTGTLKGSSRS